MSFRKRKKKLDPDIKLITSNLIFIGGVTRSGKSFLCPIASSFKKFEMFFMSSVAENISYVEKFKNIETNYASFLFKLVFNELIYNLNIGRNLNQRKSDYTSISNYNNPALYLDRMKGPEGDKVLKKIKKVKNFFPIMFHDPLINPELILKSFPKSKIIFVDRHPQELIEEWIKKKYSSNFYKNPRNVTLAIKYKNLNFPYWCKNVVSKIYNAKNNYIKSVYSLSELLLFQKKNLKSLPNNLKNRVLIVKFDDLVQKTDLEIKKIIKFLNCQTSKHTKNIILKQNGNRKINLKIREKKINHIFKYLNKETIKLFRILEKNYNE